MIKILTERVKTVDDIINALNNIPRFTSCEPFGEANCAIAYDNEKHIVYIDSIDWIDEEMNNA